MDNKLSVRTGRHFLKTIASLGNSSIAAIVVVADVFAASGVLHIITMILHLEQGQHEAICRIPPLHQVPFVCGVDHG